MWSTAVPRVSYFASGFAAGTVHSVAGGGSVVTFPTRLAFSLPPIAANATHTVALIPGSASAFWSNRDVLVHARPLVLAMTLPSLDAEALFVGRELPSKYDHGSRPLTPA